jgi:DNA polymerase (family 10)
MTETKPISDDATLSNQAVASLLQHVATVLSIQGDNIFRIKAFQTAANSIEQLGTSLYELWQDKQLDSVPGLGKRISSDMEELFTTGKVAYYDQLLKQVPAGVFPLVDLPGIGPKMAIKLATALDLFDATTAVAQVKLNAQAGKLNGLPGISSTMEKKILEIVSQPVQETSNRRALSEALAIANEIKEYLLLSAAVIECEVLGSLRRRSPTVGDIDLAICTEDASAVIAFLEKYPQVAKIIGQGDKSIAVRLVGGVRVDIKLHSPAQWGSLLQHYTGSKLHNIHLRNIALAKGLSLSEYGIKKEGGLQSYSSEQDFYAALGLQFVPPELREDTGEIEAAAKHTLPHLIELKDILGDFHIHTKLDFPTSHDMGSSSVAELLDQATALGYSYLGLSDHNPKQKGLSPAERYAAVAKRNQEIEQAVSDYYHGGQPLIKVFKGLEVDILPSGNLALEDEALKLLDYVIVSIHSDFSQDRKSTTNRILRALAHPKVRMFGHPTGRRLGKRNGVDADWDSIAAYCSEHEIAMEVNSASERLDLPYELIRSCHKQGVRFIINTDSHSAQGLHQMEFGVWMGRKGWLTKSDVKNASADLLAWLS